MARKTLLAIGIGMMLPLTAHALTMSQIKVGSLLNQPLKAVIEVSADDPGELDSLRVRLAPASQFAEKGIPMPSELDKLQFQVIRKDAKSAVVVVSTRQPVNEPFLDFLVDAKWGSGQVVREYTLLLDPPFTTDRAAPVLDIPTKTYTPARTAAPAPRVEEPVEPAPVAQPAAPAQQAQAEAPPVQQRAAPAASVQRSGDGIRVAEGNTLWSIANSVRPSGTTVYQTLEAIYRANPEAFLQNNVNLMLKGAILRVPPADEIRALDTRASQRLLAEHTRVWRPGTPVSSVGAEVADAGAAQQARGAETEASASAEVAGGADGDPTADEMRLASAGTNVAGGGESADVAGEAASSADAEDTAQELLLAREDAASAKQETMELKDRLAALQEQLEDSRRLLELKDEQLARLQAYYAQLEEQEQPEKPESLVAEEEPAEPETMATEPEAQEPDLGAVAEVAETEPVTSEADAVEPAEPETMAEEPEAQEADLGVTAEVAEGEEVAAEPADAPADEMAEPGEAAVATETQEPSAPEAATGVAETPLPQDEEAAALPPAEEKPRVAADKSPSTAGVETGLGWHSIPVIPIMLVVAVLAAISFLLVLRRHKRGEEEELVPAAVSGGGVVSLKEAQSLRETQSQSLAALLADGQYPEARELAQEMVSSDPTDVDTKIILLDIYHAQGDEQAFGAMAADMAAAGFAEDHPDHWSYVASRGRELQPDNGLYAEPAEASVADQAPPQDEAPVAEEPRGEEVLAEEDLDEMLANLESELGSAADEPAIELPEAEAGDTPATQTPDEILAAAEIEEAIGALETPTPAETEPKAPKVESDTDDTLEFETDFSLDGAEEPAPAHAAAADEGLDFNLGDWDLEEDAIPELEKKSADFEPEADIDLGLDLGLDQDLGQDTDNIVSLHGPAGDALDDGLEPDLATEPAEELAGSEESPAVSEEEEEVETKLDLARAFLDLGDAEGARGILEEVVSEGNERQRSEAQTLLQNAG